ncbi:MAG: DUF2911 domain-containing protein [Vicinamibacterales bacterium]
MRRLFVMTVLALSAVSFAWAQDTPRPPSPDGTAAAQVLGKYEKPASGRGPDVYQGGKWIEILYGRPLKRGRDLWGSGADYGKNLLVGTPIWRAGANVSTRLKTEVPLVIGGKTLTPGEYTLYIDLKENNWTFVVTTWPAATKYDPNNKTALWGSYFYTPDKDVLRTPMKLTTLPNSVEQLTWSFVDMTPNSGTLAIQWDKMMATVPFTVAN